MNATNILIEGGGWLSALLILFSYALAEFKIIRAGDLNHTLMNIAGSVGFLIIGCVHGVFSVIFLNTVWLCVAACSLYRIHKERIK